jgi:hypothetical protein
MTEWSKLSVVVILLCVLTACGDNIIIASNISVPIPTIMPPDWKYINGQEMETDDDGKQEWIAFYRFDMTCEGDQRGCPISGVVYRQDDERPPNLTPYKLYPPDKSYLCECRCSAEMKNVLTGIPGDELVIRDKCSGRITRLAIFNWDAGQGKYQPRGHFVGYCIEIGENEVEVKHRLQDRAQLMKCETYSPTLNQAYYKPGPQGEPVDAAKSEISFCTGVPEHVTLSPYPEKVVLALYTNYNKEDDVVAEYFTRKGWEALKGCEPNRCGCTVPRAEVEHVQVTDLKPEGETEGQGEDPDLASVRADVVCERINGTTDGEVHLRWLLVRYEADWKLEDVMIIPEPTE